MSRPTTNERIMAVEVKLDAIKEDISEIKNAVKNIETNHLAHINAAIQKLTDNQTALNVCVDALKQARKRSGFSNKEKAIISTTLITAIASILVACITQHV